MPGNNDWNLCRGLVAWDDSRKTAALRLRAVAEAEFTTMRVSVDIRRLAIVSTGWKRESSEIPAMADPRIRALDTPPPPPPWLELVAIGLLDLFSECSRSSLLSIVLFLVVRSVILIGLLRKSFVLECDNVRM